MTAWWRTANALLAGHNCAIVVGCHVAKHDYVASDHVIGSRELSARVIHPAQTFGYRTLLDAAPTDTVYFKATSLTPGQTVQVTLNGL